MIFERIQSQSHKVEDLVIEVDYHRLTTKLVLKESHDIVYSSYLCFCPIKNREILINGLPFTLKIFWLLLWQSKLENAQGIVVKELLPQRRRRSIGLLIYLGILTSIKVGIVLLMQI